MRTLSIFSILAAVAGASFAGLALVAPFREAQARDVRTPAGRTDVIKAMGNTKWRSVPDPTLSNNRVQSGGTRKR